MGWSLRGLLHQGGDGGDYKIGLKIIGLIIGGPLALGYTTLILLISRNQKPDFAILFGGFKRFGNSFAAYLLRFIFIILWTLLLIIPGIIAYLRYSQTFYILSEDENIGPLEAISKSKLLPQNNLKPLSNITNRNSFSRFKRKNQSYTLPSGFKENAALRWRER